MGSLKIIDCRLNAVERQMLLLQYQIAGLILKLAVLEERLNGLLASVAQLHLRLNVVERRLTRVESAVWGLAIAAAIQILLTGGLYGLILFRT